MAHARILDSTRAVLVVVDVQEAFRSAIGDFSLLASRISTAVRGFGIIGLPVIVTEQYPAGLGRTAEEILLALPDETVVVPKTAFSACGEDLFGDRFDSLPATQVVICGIEAHVCVNQTVHDLLEKGIGVHLLSDCIGSRFEHDRQAGLAKMTASGAVLSTLEMALFELMRNSKHEKFKEIQDLIK